MMLLSPMFAQYAPIPVVVIPVGDDCTAAIVSPALQSIVPPDPELELDHVALDELLDAVTPPEPMSPPVPLTVVLLAPPSRCRSPRTAALVELIQAEERSAAGSRTSRQPGEQ